MLPKICSQGYHFSRGWLVFFFLLPPPKSGDQRGFISVTHQTKTMSRGGKKQWCRTVEGRTRPHPAVLRPPPDGRVTLQVRERLLPPASTLAARPESRVPAARLSLCQCHVSGSFGRVRGRRVPERSHRHVTAVTVTGAGSFSLSAVNARALSAFAPTCCY